jgi:hypothetical protein
LREGTKLKAMNANNRLKPVKMTLRSRDKQSQDTGVLLWWIKDLTLGLSTTNWRVHDTQLELEDQWFILLIDWDSASAIKETSNKVFTGLTEGISVTPG